MVLLLYIYKKVPLGHPLTCVTSIMSFLFESCRRESESALKKMQWSSKNCLAIPLCQNVSTVDRFWSISLGIMSSSLRDIYQAWKNNFLTNSNCLIIQCAFMWMANKVLIKFFFKTDFSIIKKKSSSKFVVDFALNYVNRHVVFLIAMTQQPHPQILWDWKFLRNLDNK